MLDRIVNRLRRPGRCPDIVRAGRPEAASPKYGTPGAGYAPTFTLGAAQVIVPKWPITRNAHMYPPARTMRPFGPLTGEETAATLRLYYALV